jgi:putative acetyltransferase
VTLTPKLKISKDPEMTISIEYASPRHPEIRNLLQASHDLMGSLFPAEANHFLSIDALCDAGIHFFGVRVDGVYRACGALAVKGGYGELKSIFTDPAARGRGLGQKIIQHIEGAARDLGLSQLKLETGSLLHDAHRLYERAGFVLCGPFGEYESAEFSVFMRKDVTKV